MAGYEHRDPRLDLATSPTNDNALADARVLLVDDDALITNSLRSFLELALDLGAVVFNSSTEALEYLRTNEVDLIISDFLMPDLDGIQLLREARALRPEVPRVLLTGYADKKSAIRAINEVQLFQYVEKPWDNERLLALVKKGVIHHHQLRELADNLTQLLPDEADPAAFKRSLMQTLA